MTALVLDTHVLQWHTAERARLSEGARAAIDGAAELLVSAITWHELAWLARKGRIALALPVRSWLEQLAAGVQTLAITPQIADTAAALPDTFPGDPADRLIYATAIERGLRLVSKDAAMRGMQGSLALW